MKIPTVSITEGRDGLCDFFAESIFGMDMTNELEEGVKSLAD